MWRKLWETFVHSKICDFWLQSLVSEPRLRHFWGLWNSRWNKCEIIRRKIWKQSPFALFLISLLCWRNNIDLIWFAFLLSNMCLCFSLVLFSLSRTDFCVHKDEPCDTVGESSWTALILVDSSHSYFMGIYNHRHKYLKNKMQYLMQSVKSQKLYYKSLKYLCHVKPQENICYHDFSTA